MYNVCKEIVKTNMNKNDIISAYYVEMLFIKHFKKILKDKEFEQYTKTGSSGNSKPMNFLKMSNYCYQTKFLNHMLNVHL